MAAVAAIAAKLAVVDGILVQRSTGTYVDIGPAYPSQLTIFPSTDLPNVAPLNSYGNDTASLWYWFTDDVYYWQQSANGHISYVSGFECESICTFNLSAPRHVASWSSEGVFVDYLAAAESQVMGKEDTTTNLNYYPSSKQVSTSRFLLLRKTTLG